MIAHDTQLSIYIVRGDILGIGVQIGVEVFILPSGVIDIIIGIEHGVWQFIHIICLNDHISEIKVDGVVIESVLTFIKELIFIVSPFIRMGGDIKINFGIEEHDGIDSLFFFLLFFCKVSSDFFFICFQDLFLIIFSIHSKN